MIPVVLGIDPQTSRLGLALVEFEAPLRALWADTMRIDREDGGWRHEQITAALFGVELYALEGSSRRLDVVRVGIEEPPYVNNRAVYRDLSGVFALVGAAAHREWRRAPQITASVPSWKKDVIGTGTASKQDVAAWAMTYCAMESEDLWDLEQDSADALAIAVYAARRELVERAA